MAASGELDLFFAIADPTRRSILERLAAGERAVNELVAAFRMTQPAISQHLKVLREAGLVEVRDAGRQRLYRLAPRRLQEIAEWAAGFSRFWEKGLDRLGKQLGE